MPRNEKQSRRRNSFRTFGAFLTSHMMKKFSKKTKSKKKIVVDSDAFEAGFIDKDGSQFNSRKEESGSLTTSNGHIKNGGISSETTSLSEKGTHSIALNGSFTPPGVCGLANHGATCYINAIVQCLSNTDLLAEYFVMGQYKSDLKNAKKERSKKYGTNGELAEQLAVIIKNLWMNQYENNMTKSLKDIMCKYAPQYKGNEQHDSQEFLLWLFDKVHEDLNIQPVKKTSLLSKASFRRKKKTVENGKIALESKEIQAQLDIVPTSFIQKVFQAHFRSTLTCPNCKRQSHTMDPSLCVSLPITQRSTRPVYVNVSYLNVKRRGESKKKSRTVQISVAVPLDGKVLHLRQLVAAECGIHSRLLTFVEFDEDGFGASYGDDALISKVPQPTPTNSTLCAFEMPAPMKMTAGTLPRNFASRHKKRASYGDGSSITRDVLGSPDGSSALPKNIVIILANKKCDGDGSKVFGRPMIFHVSKEVLNNDLRSLIVSKMSEYVRKGLDSEKLASSMRLEVIDGLPNKSHISQKCTQPLLTPTVETALQNCPAGGPLHIKLIAEWDADDVDAMFDNISPDTVEEQESVRLQKLLHQQPVTCTLQECFDLLTKPEELGVEDAWNCPHCHKQRQGTVKKLSLYTLPDVLVVHLKRFRVVNDKRTKLNTRVDFPIMGLDLTPYLLESSRPRPSQNGIGHRLNGLRNFGGAASRNDDCLYDLYAVCNHFGNLNSGHYTASCLNPLDGQWYLFDDKKTELISEENLSQQSVYILFYQRRSINPSAPCAGGSVSSLAMSDHWAMNLNASNRQKASSQSRLNEYAVNPAYPIAKPVANGTSKHRNSNNNNSKHKAVIPEHPGVKEMATPKHSPSAPPSGRRFSGGYDLYRKEREQFLESRREERKRNGARNHENHSSPQVQYVKRDAPYGYYDNDFVFAREVAPIWNGINMATHMEHFSNQIDPYIPEQAFVRGVPRQQSVPRSVSKVERAPVNTRRLSERYSRQRPSSQYEPYMDTYKRTTYF